MHMRRLLGISWQDVATPAGVSKYAERKVGFTLSEGLWLAASACPHGSRMFRLLRVFLVRSKQELFREGCQIDQCAAKSIKSDHNQGLAHQMLVVTIRGD